MRRKFGEGSLRTAQLPSSGRRSEENMGSYTMHMRKMPSGDEKKIAGSNENHQLA
jgi:hypothetical protein